MYCFFSIRSLYPTFKNASIFKELIAIYYWMLSLFSCTTKPKEPEKEMLTITRSGDAYKVDTGLGSFPCIKEGGLLKCQMGIGDTMLQINDDHCLVMKTPAGVEFKFRRQGNK